MVDEVNTGPDKRYAMDNDGRDQARLLELFGKLEWDPTYDYKAERSRTKPPLTPPETHR